MEQYDCSSEIDESMTFFNYAMIDDIPEPIDQWAVADFDQFASLLIDAE
ncbi:MAG: hypothetical protein ACRER2_14380 [Methylococcales bacterium]